MKQVVIFPGYGSQTIGMGKEFYDASRVVQEYFEEASHCLDINFVKLCFSSSDSELSKITNAYPSLFLVGLSIYALLQERGVVADLLVGYNQGEYTAFCAAGSFSMPDGLYLLHKLAVLQEEYTATVALGAVRIVGLDIEVLHQLCYVVNTGSSGMVAIAIYHTRDDAIVVGDTVAINQLTTLVYEHTGVTVTSVGLGCGMHSLLVSQLALSMRMYSAKVDFHALTIPVMTDLRGAIVQMGDQVKEQLIAQITNPVQWMSMMNGLVGCDTIIIAGPAHHLYDIVKSRYPSKKVYLVARYADLMVLEQ